MNDAKAGTLTVVFAGGGSGGHISPALAVAERLAELAPQAKSVFVCSRRSIDAEMLREAGVEFHSIPATPPSMSPVGAWRFFRNFIASQTAAKRLLRDRTMGRVVALGGFVAAPVVSASRSLGVPVLLINLDCPPGKANRWMAKRCDQVISAIELPTMPQFASRVVGMPIRRRALAPGDAAHCRTRLGLDPRKPTLFVTGASQGATSINEFMIALARARPEMFRGWQLYHLTGTGADDAAQRAYRQHSVAAVVKPFLHEIGLAWGAADLAISRAGASSVAEAAANAVPTLFLPYPYHKDRHQWNNAQPLVDLGGAVITTDRIDPDENVRTAGLILCELMTDTPHRINMRK